MSEVDGRTVLRDGKSTVVLHPVDHVPGGYGFEQQIDLESGSFRGSIKAVAYANAFPRFCDDLIRVYETLKGSATIDGYENFEMVLTGDGLGHIHVKVSAVGDHLRAERLSFQMELDQTQLLEIIKALPATFL